MKAKHGIYKVALVCLFVVLACNTPDNPVFGPGNPDPNPPGTPPATISAIDPAEAFLKEIVTITGSGFNPTPELNIVHFGQQVGTILTASETQMTVELPNLGGVTVPCRVAPKGSEAWSNSMDFTFKPAVSVLANDLNWPKGVEADDDGNVYVGSSTDGVIYKIDPDGNRTVFATVPIGGHMGWGPGGFLYCASPDEGKIFRISADGSTVEDYVEAGAAIDFDWAQNGNMYIVRNWGEGIDMYDGTTVTHVADADGEELKGGRIFGDYLYVTAIWAGIILKYPITAGGLGEPETFFEGDSPVGIEADVNGTILYSLAWNYTLYTIDRDGNEGALFEDELEDDAGSPMRYIVYHGKFMYVVHPAWSSDGEGSVWQIYLGVDQAPNWGLQ